MKDKEKRILYWVILLIWMIFIFYMSNQPANISNSQSDFVLNIVRHLGLDIEGIYVNTAITIIRKGAHFIEYLILNILYFNVLRFYVGNKKALIFSIILSFIYASTDEIHQIFVAGRAGRFTDVLIDTSGAATGSILLFFIISIINKKQRS